jgi:alkaline phosphatase D
VRWRTKENEDIPNFRIAVGSCAYVNDPDYERPGTPTAAAMRFSPDCAQKPEAMLWLGDNVITANPMAQRNPLALSLRAYAQFA